MTIVCVDNTPIMLQSLKENADKAYPYADVQTFLAAVSGRMNQNAALMKNGRQ